MAKLIILRGISGSGKSTWAKAQDAAIVSRDNIRMGLFGHESMEDEDRVSNVEAQDLRYNLRQGKTVISDNTNITWKYVENIAQIGYDEGAEVEVKLFDVPLDFALRNNYERALNGGRNVPEDVIRKQYQRLQSNKNMRLADQEVPKVYIPDLNLNSAFIVDIDGTLAKMDGRSPYDWSKVEEDEGVRNIIDIVNCLASNMAVIVMSGRDEVCREQTDRWLKRYLIRFDYLLMRPKDDNRKDSIVKRELFGQIANQYNIRFVLDDRKQVVDMWRSMGLTCLQVAPGDF